MMPGVAMVISIRAGRTARSISQMRRLQRQRGSMMRGRSWGSMPLLLATPSTDSR
jgi:hypothetical protein